MSIHSSNLHKNGVDMTCIHILQMKPLRPKMTATILPTKLEGQQTREYIKKQSLEWGLECGNYDYVLIQV